MDTSSWSGDRKALPRCWLANGKAPTVRSSPMQWDASAVPTEEYCSKGQIGKYTQKKAKDVAELKDFYFNIFTVVGFRLLYTK